MTDGLITPPSTILDDLLPALLDGVDPAVRAHCARSYQFAAGAALADGRPVDEEALYLGVALHDIGLAPVADGSERFEVRGANVVRDLLLQREMDPVRVANIWDVIAMHASTPLARHKSAETMFANRGIALDVRGAGDESLSPAFVRLVLDTWPRRDFPSVFEQVLTDEVRGHPDSVRMSWLESVAVEHIPGFKATDFLVGLRASSHFT